ncbi:MAG TPA: dephospho-CoA kinase [Fimbriimonas sp.]|nr:dephospho-CoA kinase [Fimbriimonas sp.]
MKIALIGGIACGKSTVLGLLREMGVSVENADAIAKDVFWNPGVQARLRDAIRREPTPMGVREAIAANPELRRTVNAITHPAILSGILSSTAQVFEVPLLLETAIQGHFDAIWTVVCDPEVQKQRLHERYGNGASDGLIQAQLSTKCKVAFADAIIPTSGPLIETEKSLLEEAKRWALTLAV